MTEKKVTRKTTKKKTAKKKAVARKTPAKKMASPRFAQSMTELASILGVSRKALYDWKKLDGSPVPRSDGRHSIAEWRKFMASNDLAGRSLDMETLKARKLQAEIDAREFDLAVKRGEYVRLSTVQEIWGSCIGDALTVFDKCLQDTMPPIWAGMDDPVEIRKKNEQVCIELREILHNGSDLTP